MRFILAILIVFFSSNCFAFWTKGTDTAPEVQTFCKRVLDDGGTVIDVEYMDKMVKLLKQLGIWGNVKFLGDANFAVKLNGSGVTKFYDLSGNNNDAVQGTVANQPVWTSGVTGPKAGLIFDGTNDFIKITTGVTSVNMATFVVARYDNPGTALSYILGGEDDTLYGYDDDGQGIRFRGAGGGGYFGGLKRTDVYGAYKIFETNTVATTGSLWINGSVQAGTISVVPTMYVDLIGAYSTYGRYFFGIMSSVIICDIALTTAQRITIEIFLNSYFSIY